MSLLSKLGFHTDPSDTSGISLSAEPEVHEPVETIREAAFNAQEVVDLSRTSLDFLAALAIPTVYAYHYPPVFLAVWDWLKSYVHKTRDFSQLALGLPRIWQDCIDETIHIVLHSIH